MAFFIDRWYGEAENLYYKGWIIEGRVVANTAGFNVVLDDLNFVISIDNIHYDAIIGKRPTKVITADRVIDFDMLTDSFDFEVIINANN